MYFARLGVLILFSICLWGKAVADPIEIEVALFDGAEGIGFYQEVAREYEKMRPGVKVNLHGSPRINDILNVRFLDGDFPEVISAVGNADILIRSGLILPLNEWLEKPAWDGMVSWRDTFSSGSLNGLTSADGKVFGVPLAYFVNCVWYNRKLFPEYGWKPPQTWEDFVALCRKVKARGIAPLAFQGLYHSYAQVLVNASYRELAGAARYDDLLQLKPGSFNNPEMVESLRRLQIIAVEFFQPGAMGMSHTEAQLQFFVGNTAMVVSGSWLKNEMQGKIPAGFELGAFNFPYSETPGDDAETISVKSGNFMVLSKSKHPEIGVDFLRYLTSRQNAVRYVQKMGIPSAIRSANDGNLPEDMMDLQTMISTSVNTIAPDNPVQRTEHQDMRQAWDDVRYKLLSNRTSPEAAAASLEEAGRRAVERAKHPEKVEIRHPVKAALLMLSVIGVLAWGVAKWVRASSSPKENSLAKLPRGKFGTLAMFIAPALAIYSVFFVGPSVYSFVWSLLEWDGLGAKTWVGLLNFGKLIFESDRFWKAMGNNFFLMLVIPSVVIPVSLLLAFLLSRRVPGHSMFRVIFFFPNLIGGVAATLLWMHLYNPNGGILSAAFGYLAAIFGAVGMPALAETFRSLQHFAWLAPENLYWATIPIFLWGSCGFNMILFLAAMEGVPEELYEASKIDGAGPVRQFFHISLPQLRPILFVASVFLVIGGMKTFELIWLLTNQAPITETHVLGTLIVQTMFVEYRIGQAAALAVLLFLIVLAMTVVMQNLKKEDIVE